MAYDNPPNFYQMHGAFLSGEGNEGEYVPMMDGAARKQNTSP